MHRGTDGGGEPWPFPEALPKGQLQTRVFIMCLSSVARLLGSSSHRPGRGSEWEAARNSKDAIRRGLGERGGPLHRDLNLFMGVGFLDLYEILE